jgi:hypothetical protein
VKSRDLSKISRDFLKILGIIYYPRKIPGFEQILELSKDVKKILGIFLDIEI